MHSQSFKKILFIGSYLSKHRGSIGPTELLAQCLSKRNFKVILASTYENKFIRLIDTLIKLIFYSGKIVYIDVYSGNAFRIAEVSAFIGKLRKKKLVFMLHGGALPEFIKSNTFKVKRLLKNQQYVFSPSHYICHRFNEYDISVKYQPNGINLDNFPFAKIDFSTPIALLWVRAFDSIYNPHIAVEILYKLKKEFPQATLTMIGPNRGMLNETKRLIAKLNLQNSVQIIGAVKNELLYQYYQTHSILINTTTYESFGVSLIEAASCGIPIVSNNVGEIKYIWKKGKDIRLVENNNIEEFVSETKLLFLNANLREEQILNAKINSANFNNQTTDNFWYNLLNNL